MRDGDRPEGVGGPLGPCLTGACHDAIAFCCRCSVRAYRLRDRVDRPVILPGQGDLQTSWTIRWPATGTQGPASFDGIIDGGTAHFAAAHGTFHAATLPDGDMQITAEIDEGQR